jgi:uridylate kinase
MQTAKYKRVIIKLSGEALAGEKGNGIDQKVLDMITDQIIAVKNLGVEIGIIVGGGNFWRGRQGTEMDRSQADHMGMLATVINALAIQDALERKNAPTRVQTALTITRVAEPYILRKAMSHLNKGRIVIFACGTGNPYFTTDTAAALRACEIDADILLMAKNVDGIYDSDPKTNPEAKKYETLKYSDIINRNLKVIDFTAATMCMENDVPTLAFGLNVENSIVRAVCGEEGLGTIISV